VHLAIPPFHCVERVSQLERRLWGADVGLGRAIAHRQPNAGTRQINATAGNRLPIFDEIVDRLALNRIFERVVRAFSKRRDGAV
jgi:hypothetical protein